MKSIKPLLMACFCAALMFSCSQQQAPDLPSVIQTPLQFDAFHFPNIRSVSIAGNSNGELYLAYGNEHSLYVSRSSDAGRTFNDAVLATENTQAHVLPVEKPAIAVDNESRVAVAWLELPSNFQGASIWYAISENKGSTFKPPVLAATEDFGEVAMVQLAFDTSGNPVLAWINGSTLKFTRSFDGGQTFTKVTRISGSSCECCQPSIVVTPENIFIAYRGLEAGGTQGDIRDILLIRSNDEGQSFEAPARVSDTNWHIPACPIAGPSMVMHDGTLFVAWMDGRFEPIGSFRRGDAWFASSANGGITFSTNVRINHDQDSHHTLPVIAVGPGGRIHVAWESLNQTGGANRLYYTTSDDKGVTFAPPQVITDNSDPALGNPGKPVLFVDALGNVTLAWLDRSGGQIAVWNDPN